MNIVSSIIYYNLIQIDGRSNIREVHTDDQGNEYEFIYMADPDTNIKEKLAARAIELGGE